MKNTKTALTLALGTAFTVSLAVGAAHAAESPFAMKTLEHGYRVADAGDAMSKKSDGKCGATKGAAVMEKKADAMPAKAQDGKCGGSKTMSKKSDGKCGAKK
ncbi:MAG: hypothetical protein ACYC2R_00410 [Burkholderiales bacterium]